MKRVDEEDDEIRNQEKLDAEAEILYAEHQLKEKIADELYGVGGVEPDPEDLLYD